jgi:hypothetical protein
VRQERKEKKKRKWHVQKKCEIIKFAHIPLKKERFITESYYACAKLEDFLLIILNRILFEKVEQLLGITFSQDALRDLHNVRKHSFLF